MAQRSFHCICFNLWDFQTVLNRNPFFHSTDLCKSKRSRIVRSTKYLPGGRQCTKKGERSTRYNVPTTEKQVPSYLPLRLGDFARKKKKEGLYEVPAWRQAGRSKRAVRFLCGSSSLRENPPRRTRQARKVAKSQRPPAGR